MRKAYTKPISAPQIEPNQLTLYPYFFHTVDSMVFAASENPKTPIIVVKKVKIAPMIPPAIPPIKGLINKYSTILNQFILTF